MSKKISPRVREQAAIYCSARASWWAGPPGELYFESFGKKAEDLAGAVFVSIPDRGVSFTELWAEAEALLRTGWEP